jgi:tetratricopeptide (TPR) repeat protein
LRRTAVVAVVLLIGVGGALVGWYLVRDAATSRQLTEAIDAVDRADPGWRLAELDAGRAAVPDAQNGALVVLRAAALFPPPFGPRLSAILSAELYQSPDVRLTDARYATLLNDLKSEDQDALAIVASLADLPAGRYPTAISTDFTANPLPQWQATWSVAWHALWPLAYVHAHEGDITAALRDFRGLLNLARTFDDEPNLWSQHRRADYRDKALRFLERALAHGEAPAADLATVQAELAREERYDSWAVVVRCERAMAHELLGQVEQGQVTLEDALLQMGKQSYAQTTAFADYYQPGLLGPSLRSRLRVDHAALLGATTRLLETARLPAHEQSAHLRALQRSEAPTSPALTRTTVGNLVNRFAAEQVRRAKLRSVVAVLAVERYRLARGRWPESLAALVPEFLAAVPADPYDGQPLRYRRLADGVVVYSVGPDGADGGGQSNPDPPGPNFGCMLWDISRRHPPPPPKSAR